MIKQADYLFSLIIRAQDKRCMYCVTTKNLTCGHYISRSRFNTRYDEKNATTLCFLDHRYFTDNPFQHEILFVDLLTKEVTVDLWIKANKLAITFKSWYGGKQHVKELRKRLKELQ